MIGAYENSPLRCPRSRCGKRLVMQLGQHESTGELEELHFCLSCDYRESKPWRRRKALAKLSFAEILSRRARLHDFDPADLPALIPAGGVEVPIHYDRSPFPVSDFDREVP